MVVERTTLVIGSRSSGKSALIQSLINSLHKNTVKEATITKSVTNPLHPTTIAQTYCIPMISDHTFVFIDTPGFPLSPSIKSEAFDSQLKTHSTSLESPSLSAILMNAALSMLEQERKQIYKEYDDILDQIGQLVADLVSPPTAILLVLPGNLTQPLLHLIDMQYILTKLQLTIPPQIITNNLLIHFSNSSRLSCSQSIQSLLPSTTNLTLDPLGVFYANNPFFTLSNFPTSHSFLVPTDDEILEEMDLEWTRCQNVATKLLDSISTIAHPVFQLFYREPPYLHEKVTSPTPSTWTRASNSHNNNNNNNNNNKKKSKEESQVTSPPPLISTDQSTLLAPHHSQSNPTHPLSTSSLHYHRQARANKQFTHINNPFYQVSIGHYGLFFPHYIQHFNNLQRQHYQPITTSSTTTTTTTTTKDNSSQLCPLLLSPYHDNTRFPLTIQFTAFLLQVKFRLVELISILDHLNNAKILSTAHHDDASFSTYIQQTHISRLTLEPTSDIHIICQRCARSCSTYTPPEPQPSKSCGGTTPIPDNIGSVLQTSNFSKSTRLCTFCHVKRCHQNLHFPSYFIVTEVSDPLPVLLSELEQVFAAKLDYENTNNGFSSLLNLHLDSVPSRPVLKSIERDQYSYYLECIESTANDLFTFLGFTCNKLITNYASSTSLSPHLKATPTPPSTTTTTTSSPTSSPTTPFTPSSPSVPQPTPSKPVILCPLTRLTTLKSFCSNIIITFEELKTSTHSPLAHSLIRQSVATFNDIIAFLTTLLFYISSTDLVDSMVDVTIDTLQNFRYNSIISPQSHNSSTMLMSSPPASSGPAAMPKFYPHPIHLDSNLIDNDSPSPVQFTPSYFQPMLNYQKDSRDKDKDKDPATKTTSSTPTISSTTNLHHNNIRSNNNNSFGIDNNTRSTKNIPNVSDPSTTRAPTPTTPSTTTTTTNISTISKPLPNSAAKLAVFHPPAISNQLSTSTYDTPSISTQHKLQQIINPPTYNNNNNNNNNNNSLLHGKSSSISSSSQYCQRYRIFECSHTTCPKIHSASDRFHFLRSRWESYLQPSSDIPASQRIKYCKEFIHKGFCADILTCTLAHDIKVQKYNSLYQKSHEEMMLQQQQFILDQYPRNNNQSELISLRPQPTSWDANSNTNPHHQLTQKRLTSSRSFHSHRSTSNQDSNYNQDDTHHLDNCNNDGQIHDYNHTEVFPLQELGLKSSSSGSQRPPPSASYFDDNQHSQFNQLVDPNSIYNKKNDPPPPSYEPPTPTHTYLQSTADPDPIPSSVSSTPSKSKRDHVQQQHHQHNQKHSNHHLSSQQNPANVSFSGHSVHSQSNYHHNASNESNQSHYEGSEASLYLDSSLQQHDTAAGIEAQLEEVHLAIKAAQRDASQMTTQLGGPQNVCKLFHQPQSTCKQPQCPLVHNEDLLNLRLHLKSLQKREQSLRKKVSKIQSQPQPNPTVRSNISTNTPHTNTSTTHSPGHETFMCSTDLHHSNHTSPQQQQQQPQQQQQQQQQSHYDQPSSFSPLISPSDSNQNAAAMTLSRNNSSSGPPSVEINPDLYSHQSYSRQPSASNEPNSNPNLAPPSYFDSSHQTNRFLLTFQFLPQRFGQEFCNFESQRTGGCLNSNCFFSHDISAYPCLAHNRIPTPLYLTRLTSQYQPNHVLQQAATILFENPAVPISALHLNPFLKCSNPSCRFSHDSLNELELKYEILRYAFMDLKYYNEKMLNVRGRRIHDLKTSYFEAMRRVYLASADQTEES